MRETIKQIEYHAELADVTEQVLYSGTALSWGACFVDFDCRIHRVVFKLKAKVKNSNGTTNFKFSLAF